MEVGLFNDIALEIRPNLEPNVGKASPMPVTLDRVCLDDAE
jgi:hypothetical protein